MFLNFSKNKKDISSLQRAQLPVFNCVTFVKHPLHPYIGYTTPKFKKPQKVSNWFQTVTVSFQKPELRAQSYNS